MYQSKFNKAYNKILKTYDISLLYESCLSHHKYLTDTNIQQQYIQYKIWKSLVKI